MRRKYAKRRGTPRRRLVKSRRSYGRNKRRSRMRAPRAGRIGFRL